MFVINFISYGQTSDSLTVVKNQLKMEGIITPNNEEISIDVYGHTFDSESLDNWQFLGNEKMTEDYVFNVNLGFIYLLVFNRPNGESKRILVGATRKDHIEVNIDFLKNKKKLYFIYIDKKSDKYKIELLKNESKLSKF